MQRACEEARHVAAVRGCFRKLCARPSACVSGKLFNHCEKALGSLRVHSNSSCSSQTAIACWADRSARQNRLQGPPDALQADP
eukprot:scaffold4470_cov255-Prasinococcus_capsulatus_cf.AAC.27